MKTIELNEFTVSYDDSQETKDSVFEAVIAFYKKHESFSGEEICQCDGPVIDAHSHLANIADDIIKFDVKWNDL